MAIAGAHFISQKSIDAIYCDSIDVVTTSGTNCTSTDTALGTSVVEIVSTQPCYIGFNVGLFAEDDLLDKSPLLYLDATKLGDTYSDGDNITSWADASGNGFDADEATDCPSYDADGLDGTNPSAHFDGSEFLNSAITASSSTFTVMVVGKSNNSSGVAALLDFTALLELEYDADNDKFDYNTGTSNATAAGVVQDSPFLLTASPSGIWQNGEQLVSSMTLVNRALTAVAIGSDDANTGNFLDGEISAVLVFDGELNTECRQAVEWYLANEYDITLDSSHPYSTSYANRAHVTSSTGIYLPANTVRRFVVNPNHYMAVLRAGGTDATVNIVKAREV